MTAPATVARPAAASTTPRTRVATRGGAAGRNGVCRYQCASQPARISRPPAELTYISTLNTRCAPTTGCRSSSQCITAGPPTWVKASQSRCVAIPATNPATTATGAGRATPGRRARSPAGASSASGARSTWWNSTSSSTPAGRPSSSAPHQACVLAEENGSGR